MLVRGMCVRLGPQATLQTLKFELETAQSAKLWQIPLGLHFDAYQSARMLSKKRGLTREMLSMVDSYLWAPKRNEFAEQLQVARRREREGRVVCF